MLTVKLVNAVSDQSICACDRDVQEAEINPELLALQSELNTFRGHDLTSDCSNEPLKPSAGSGTRPTGDKRRV